MDESTRASGEAQNIPDYTSRHGKAKARHRMSEIDLEISHLQNEKAEIRAALSGAKAEAAK